MASHTGKAAFGGLQRGFTVVELVLVMALGALLMPVTVTSIFQIVRGTDRTNTENVALADIDSASTWIGRDLTMGRTFLDPDTLAPLISCSSGTGPKLRAEWVDKTLWGASTPDHYLEYYVEPGTTRLARKYDGIVSIAGRRVASISFCRNSGGFVQVNITSFADGVAPSTKTRFFYTDLRVDGS